MRLRKSKENELQQEVRKKLNGATIEVRRIGDFLCTTALLQSGYVLTDTADPGALDSERMNRLERKLYELEHYAWQLKVYEKIEKEEREEKSRETQPSNGRDIGWAVKKMKERRCVRRKPWIGLELLMEWDKKTETYVIYKKFSFEEDGTRLVEWRPTQQELLAVDWVVSSCECECVI